MGITFFQRGSLFSCTAEKKWSTSIVLEQWESLFSGITFFTTPVDTNRFACYENYFYSCSIIFICFSIAPDFTAGVLVYKSHLVLCRKPFVDIFVSFSEHSNYFLFKYRFNTSPKQLQLCRFFVKPSKSILSGAQCVAVAQQKKGLARFLNKRAELLEDTSKVEDPEQRISRRVNELEGIKLFYPGYRALWRRYYSSAVKDKATSGVKLIPKRALRKARKAFWKEVLEWFSFPEGEMDMGQL